MLKQAIGLCNFKPLKILRKRIENTSVYIENTLKILRFIKRCGRKVTLLAKINFYNVIEILSQRFTHFHGYPEE